MGRLARRSDEAEWMDGAEVEFEALRGCLEDLAQVNRMSGGYRPTLAFLERLRRAGRLPVGRPVEILDLGSGYGDGLRAVDAWAARRGVPVRLVGLDLSPSAARAAAGAMAPGRPIRWETGDALVFEGEADVILSALFMHHLADAEVVRLLRRMEERARVGWFVNDLHRHPVAYWGFGPLAATMRMHPFVRHDGPVSFARAFVQGDWARLLREAGVPPGAAEVRRWFPFRLCVARARAA